MNECYILLVLFYIVFARSFFQGLVHEHRISPYETRINDRERQKALNSAVSLCKEII